MKRILERNVVSIMQVPLSVSDFQKNAATGTFTANPENINNGSTGNAAVAWNIGEYAIVDFGQPMIFTQYRHYGNANNWGVGEWKIEYWNAWKQGWVDWTGLFYTRATWDWSSWVSRETIESEKIRLLCVTPDAKNNRSYINQLEMIL